MAAGRAGQHTGALRHGDDAALLGELCALRDELHIMAAEIAEDVATPARHEELAERLWNLSGALGHRGRRLAIHQGAPEP